MWYKEVQELIEVPTIAYLCSLFHAPLGTPDFEIEELEDALVHNTKCEDMFGGDFLDNIVISLLKGCIPTHQSKLTCMNYSLYLTQFLQTSIEDHEEEYPSLSCNIFNPFTDDKQEFNQLTLQEKVNMILQLIDLRLDTEDAPERIKSIPVDSLRLEHMGEDSDGALYWYFYGTRLYKETKQRRKSKPKKKDDKQDTKTKKDSKKGKKVEIEEVTSDSKDEDSSDLVKDSAPSWTLICQTEADWTKLVESLKKSKKKADKELFEVLNENFLPQVVQMFQDKEREERLKLMMMNKRSSSRITKKEQERKVEEEKRRIEEEEEERQMQIEEKEEALARLKENYNARKNGRDTRHKEKVEQLLMEQEEESKASREQRLKERKLKRLSNEAVAHEQEKKYRLDTERQRREAVERDHDYLGSRSNRQEATQTASQNRRGTQRAAAKKEWHRLADFDDGNHRSIRY